MSFSNFLRKRVTIFIDTGDKRRDMTNAVTHKEIAMMRMRVTGMIVLLSVQYVAGMTLNMFGAEDIRKGTLFQKGLLLTHVILALLLLTGSLITMIFVKKGGSAMMSKKAMHGFSAIVIAVIAGFSTLLLKGTITEITSLIMAIAFLGAFWFYGYLFFLLRKESIREK